MDQTTFSIITGVFAGLLTTVLLYLARQLWIGTIYPAWEDAIYKDTKIEGRWEADVFPVAFDPTRVRELIRDVKNKERIKFISTLKVISEEAARKAKEKEQPEENKAEKPQAQGSDSKNNIEEKARQRVSEANVEDAIELENFTISLTRTGHHVNGYMLGTVGSNKGRNYKVCGSFRNLILTATLEPESSSCIERGALCLSLRNNGATFEGYIATYVDDSHRIAALKTVWNRSA